MRDPILVVNAGSSSIKFSVFGTREDRSLSLGVHGQVENIGLTPHLDVSDADGRQLTSLPVPGRDHDDAVEAIHAWFKGHAGSKGGFVGVGHRVVYGGIHYSQSVLIDDEIVTRLEEFVPLAPLHQPHNIAVIRAIASITPGVPQVACFDTAFHRSLPAVEQQFALPRTLAAKGVRRYGFHGLSYEYIVSVLPGIMDGRPWDKLVVAHLGNGASMCAVERGRSIACTMGFTAVDGLPMGTRTGALDPGVILYLLQSEGMDVKGVEELIYRRSGLLGVSGISSDMRALLTSDAPEAKEAVDLFAYRIGRELGSLAAALGGLDALVFTGGIGEHAVEVRAAVCRYAKWLGVALDEGANVRGGPLISSATSSVSAWVVPTDENLMIARHTRSRMESSNAGT